MFLCVSIIADRNVLIKTPGTHAKSSEIQGDDWTGHGQRVDRAPVKWVGAVEIPHRFGCVSQLIIICPFVFIFRCPKRNCVYKIFANALTRTVFRSPTYPYFTDVFASVFHCLITQKRKHLPD